jgi:DNA-binding transcriptional ArsR family regulator
MAAKAAAKAQAAPAPDVRLTSVREDIPRLEGLIHEKLRLGIVSALAAAPSLTFMELKKLLNTSDGNLSVHARKLEEAGYIICEKYFEGRMPRTVFRITATGREALRRYLNHMEALVKAMRESE